MEQTHSATNPIYGSMRLETSSNHGPSNYAWSQDRRLEPSLPMEQMASFGRQCVVPPEQGRGCDLIPDLQPPVKQSIPAHADLVNAPIADYRSASDEQLLATARISDGQAFVELTGRYAQTLYRRVIRILRNREDAEDAVQEALLRAYAHLGEFRGTCAFSTWLTRIAINSALMLLRKRRSCSEVSIDQSGDKDQGWGDREIPDPSPNAEQIYAKQQTNDLLSRAVTRLPASYRCVVEECHGRERSLQEAADVLGITVAAAKSRLLRARLSIRSTLEKSGFPLRMRFTQKRRALPSSQQVAPEIRSRFVSTTSR